MAFDTLLYIRDRHKVPAYKGAKVTYKGRPGVITGAQGPHIKVKLEGGQLSLTFHPLEVAYSSAEGTVDVTV